MVGKFFSMWVDIQKKQFPPLHRPSLVIQILTCATFYEKWHENLHVAQDLRSRRIGEAGAPYLELPAVPLVTVQAFAGWLPGAALTVPWGWRVGL